MMLDLQQVTAGYRKLQILHELSLHVEENEIVSLIGANGAGKTTTLRAIAGLIGTTGGTIRFEGKEIQGARPDTPRPMRIPSAVVLAIRSVGTTPAANAQAPLTAVIRSINRGSTWTSSRRGSSRGARVTIPKTIHEPATAPSAEPMATSNPCSTSS